MHGSNTYGFSSHSTEPSLQTRVTPYTQCLRTTHEPQPYCEGQYSASLDVKVSGAGGRDSSVSVVTLGRIRDWIPDWSSTLCLLQYVQTCCGAPPSLQWVLRVLSSGVKWPGREVDHSSPPSDEISTSGAVPPTLRVFIPSPARALSFHRS